MSENAELLTEVHVWHLDPHKFAAAGLGGRFLCWLSDDEKKRHEALRTDALRWVYLLTRALCRSTLSRYCGVNPAAWVFARNEFGKPVISEPVEFRGIWFNLTHTGGLVACAVTRIGEVGLDAEETSRAIDAGEIAPLFLSDVERAELERLPSQDRDIRLFEFWVLKEAYLKGKGTGLMQSPETITIQFTDTGQIVPPDGWQLALHRPSARHVAATAVCVGAPPPIQWFELETIL